LCFFENISSAESANNQHISWMRNTCTPTGPFSPSMYFNIIKQKLQAKLKSGQEQVGTSILFTIPKAYSREEGYSISTFSVPISVKPGANERPTKSTKVETNMKFQLGLVNLSNVDVRRHDLMADSKAQESA